MKRKIALTLVLLVMSLGMVVAANAQNKRLFKGVNWKQRIEDARSGKTEIDKEALARVEEAYAEKPEYPDSSILNLNLTGTYFITVPGPTPADDFFAYWTLGDDGTFVETSSILVTLNEGPAHGAYEKRGRGAILTFELFAFDPEAGVSVGRIRVRATIQTEGRDHITGYAAAEFLDPDGTIIPLGAGPYSGERVQVRRPY